MDILTKKRNNEYKENLANIIGLLVYSNSYILVGSSSFEFQKYSADYDLMNNINNYGEKKPNPNIFNQFLETVIHRICKTNDLYFIELKVQLYNGTKIRFSPKNHYNPKALFDNYDNINFVKIDIIMNDNLILKEVSCIYKFDYKPISKKDFEKIIRGEIQDKIAHHKYFKALKRLFSLYRIQGEQYDDNLKKIYQLTDIFNSELGMKYSIMSNLETIELLLSHYRDTFTKKLVKLNLEKVGVSNNIKDVGKNFKKLEHEVNSKAKLLLENL